ncbi:LamB/YcsF family protein [Bacillus sp. APMAM]|nr:LamB/YcsF family protein [Bacillus sp. APMAM]RTZ56354.1 hypothetical protein EKO25_07725 [Bacillus sp. SAJ1]
MADSDKEMATNIVDAVLSVRPDLPILVKPNSQLHLVAKEKGLPFILELFADREYNNDFSLVSRNYEGAVITDPEKVAERVIKMVMEGKVTTFNGEEVEVQGETICVHGDTPTALDLIRVIKQKLESMDIKIAPFSI